MTIYSYDGIAPEVAADAWIAPDANLIGRVRIAALASVWFGASLRGDNEPISLGAGSNIQEGCVLHTDPGFPLEIGADCTIGHKAILHGCTIGEGSLVGMGAIVLNGARIGRGCLIGAGALVTEGKEIPDGSLVVGAPGKVLRNLDAAAQQALGDSAARYRAKARRFAETLRPL
jgi:carbonic anhydrase/acetyltransferase-like protein (isoleucine patch superfamily)